MVIGRRPDSSPGDEENFERVPDPDFAQLPDDYGEWDDEDRPHGGYGRVGYLHVYGKAHPDAEDYKRAEEMIRYLETTPRFRSKRSDIIGRRSYENEQPVPRPRGMLPQPGDEDYCPFEDAERKGISVEDLRAKYQLFYRNEPEVLKDINDKIARAGMH